MAALRRRLRQLRVTSVPTGAVVKLNGRTVGSTPFASDTVSEGKHRLTVAKDGYARAERSVAVGASTPTVHLVLSRLTGTLKIAVNPPSAHATVGGRRFHASDLGRGIALGTGEHTLDLTANGYASRSMSVKVVHGRTSAYRVQLTAKNARLHVETTPAGATVSVNGRVIGKSPLTESGLAHGTYTLTAKKPEHLVLTRSVKLLPGGYSALKLKLELKSWAKAYYSARGKRILWGSAALAGGLAVTGTAVYFFVRGGQLSNTLAGIEQDLNDPFVTNRAQRKADWQSTSSDIATNDALKWTFGGVGLALVGVSTYLFLTMPKKSEWQRRVKAALHIGPGGEHGLTIVGTF